MIVYSSTKGQFINDVNDGILADILESKMKEHHIPFNEDSEWRAWNNSMRCMKDVLDDEEIENECKVAIEYQVPLTSRRVDFLICGQDDNGSNNVVVVELKQWEDSEETDRPDIVKAFVGRCYKNLSHPSYQAYSYAKIIENFNEAVQKNDIKLEPCAYLHNYREVNRDHIDNDFYKEAIESAPIFLQRDSLKLNQFIKKFIKKKDDIDILMQIENGKLKPSKSLQNAIKSMLEGNQEFYLIDEQKVAYETIKKIITVSLKNTENKNNESGKYTIIIKGGPGTGKSVIAVQLLADLLKEGRSAVYSSKNHTPRDIYFSKLAGSKYKKAYLKSLFLGSGSFVNAKFNQFDCILCDEAHRLNEKSGLYNNLGENQIKEIIRASIVSVFFLDEDQIVTMSDIGSVDQIKEWAFLENSEVICDEDLTLTSQFRCNGSDAYLAFLDNLLEIRKTANEKFDVDYELRLFNSPTKMREELRKKNTENKARMLAGYCYNWITKLSGKESSDFDIVLEDNFKARWNLNKTLTWAIDSDSFDEVGCVHTSQGIEFDYVGVIIGNDLRYENGKIVTDPTKRAKTDVSLKGYKSRPDGLALADRIIKDTYRVLLTRGQKGCYIYCEDKELLKHISEMTDVAIEH